MSKATDTAIDQIILGLQALKSALADATPDFWLAPTKYQTILPFDPPPFPTGAEHYALLITRDPSLPANIITPQLRAIWATVLEPPPPLQPPQLYNTGTQLEGNVDTQWTLIASADATTPGPNTYTVDPGYFPLGAWPPDNEISSWLAPSPTARSPVGDYTYRQTFPLTGFSPLKITGRVMSDDFVAIKLNGHMQGAQLPGFRSGWIPFTITSPFADGSNTLDFTVTNIGGAIGLRVELQLTLNSSVIITNPQT